MDQLTASAFAADWVAAWNAHDLERILAHYAEDVELVSPVAQRLLGQGRVTGKPALRAYFRKGLDRLPDLKFELIATTVGVEGITLVYRGAGGGLVAEHLKFGADGHKVRHADVHYAGLPIPSERQEGASCSSIS